MNEFFVFFSDFFPVLLADETRGGFFSPSRPWGNTGQCGNVTAVSIWRAEGCSCGRLKNCLRKSLKEEKTERRHRADPVRFLWVDTREI